MTSSARDPATPAEHDLASAALRVYAERRAAGASREAALSRVSAVVDAVVIRAIVDERAIEREERYRQMMRGKPGPEVPPPATPAE